MGYFRDLRLERFIEPRVAVAVDVAPQTTYAVEISIAIDIDKPAAFSALDDQRIILGHLGKRVPDNMAIPVPQLRGCWRHKSVEARKRVNSRG